MRAESSHRRLQTRIRADQRRIAKGERPVYHVMWTTTPEAIDVTIRELPIIHLFVPDHLGVSDGARGLIARTLGVDQASFGLVTQETTSN
jgi:hypothetical protein